ncbi:hypothetical protein L873DRAFT_608330 [Choiromyces venosus 120613-1]|uniref:Uncharacterized protein n=1 Tax=Choiromyces venosus 120613-1 TaxID=1336337 RepID=A0A3N4K7E8_9PEZI|nr:hypothetical protein L873DRAFT_608330 [Choiromyces venosus 120613-1]
MRSYISSLNSLFTNTSNSYIRPVQLPGMGEEIMLFWWRRSRIARVLWEPIKSRAKRVGQPSSAGIKYFVIYCSKSVSFI